MARVWIAIVLAVAVIAAAGAANAQTLSRERLNQPSAITPQEMAALLRGLLTGRPGVGALRVEAGDIVFHAAGRDVRMGLTPLSSQFNALPDATSRQGAFDKLAQRVDEAVSGTVAVKSEAESRRFHGALVPVLKNRAFAEQFAAAARKQGAPHARLLHVPLAGDIIVAAALDMSKVTRFLAAGDGGAYGMSDPDILQAALDNLVRRVDRLEIRDFGLLRTFHFGEGDYNASILLLPNPWEKVPNLPRSVAIGVPSRNLLAFADADDAKAVAALRALTKAPGNAFPVSRQLYQLSERGLTVIP